MMADILITFYLLICSRPYLINELKLQHLLHDRRKVYAVRTTCTCFVTNNVVLSSLIPGRGLVNIWFSG